MAKKLFLTGAGGFVGGAIAMQARRLDAAWELHAITRKYGLPARRGVVWHTTDIMRPGELGEVFRQVKPDAVIHAAAIADIDFCEANVDTARAVNIDLTAKITELCGESGAKLVFVSTDTIFDGERGGYREEDAPGAVNVYAETKICAEEAVRSGASRWGIGRICLVMGLPLLGDGNTFLPKMIETLRAGREMGVPKNEVRSPIDVVTAARALMELAAGEPEGVFHLAGNDTLPRFDMAQRIAKRLGYPKDLIKPTDSSSIAGRAPRPRDVSLNNEKARKMLRTPMLGLEAGLDLAIQSAKP